MGGGGGRDDGSAGRHCGLHAHQANNAIESDIYPNSYILRRRHEVVATHNSNSHSTNTTRLSLARSEHTLSVVGNKAYVFGGETGAGKLASNDIHSVTLDSSGKPDSEYALIPAVADIGADKVPAPRKQHAACGFNVCVAMFGGVGEDEKLVDNEPIIWLFNSAKPAWETMKAANSDPAPKQRSSARLFNYRNSLVLYGGIDASGEKLNDVWHFSYVDKTWTQLPDAPISTPHASLWDGALYLVTGSDNMSGDLHFLQLAVKKDQKQEWGTVSFPTNPLTPGPLPRQGAGLLGTSTGYGRNYLLYMFGARQHSPVVSAETVGNAQSEESKDAAPQYWSDMWTFQLPSSQPEVKATTNLYDAMKPSKIKDSIREAIGAESGKHSWAEVEVLPPSDLVIPEGKVHPGPRGFFASDVMEDGRSVVLWGGVNPKGEKEGDGWIIKIE